MKKAGYRVLAADDEYWSRENLRSLAFRNMSAEDETPGEEAPEKGPLKPEDLID